MDIVKFGIVGVGGMGSGHARMMQNIDEAQLVAVCDEKKEVAERVGTQYDVPAFTDHKDLIASGLADAIIVATPHYFHPPVAVDAMHAGLHVLSEKPVAVTVKAADTMIQAAKETGQKFGVMFQMRTDKTYRIAKKAIDDGLVGEVYRTGMVIGWYRSQAYYNSATWRATWVGEGGGVLLNQAPHNLDIFTWLTGVPKRVTAQVRTRKHNIEVEDEAFALLEYENGAHGYLYASVNEVPGTSRTEVCGDKGKVVIDGSSVKVYQMEMPILEYTHSTDQMWGSPKSEQIQLEVEEMSSGHATITRNFARSILYGEPLISPGEEGIKGLELSNAIILSGKRGKTVETPLDRDEYETLIEELKAISQKKEGVVEQRVTDPSFA